MSPLSYRADQLVEPPYYLQDHLIGNHLFAIAQFKNSVSKPPLTLIAYDALRSRAVRSPVYCLVWKLNKAHCASWRHSRRPIIEEEEDCFLILDTVIPPIDFILPACEEQGLVYLKELGEGAQGLVYLCHDILRSTAGLPCFSAVKILPPANDEAQSARQQREIMHHSTLSSHPNIVTLHRSFRIKTHHFLVMDYHPGIDLDTFITNEPNFYLNSTERVRSAILQLIDAVQFTHDHGIYHCDVKPANIFVSQDGSQLFLGDFGFATQDFCPGPGGICGTFAYLSPETFFDTNASNELKDRWALGITALYIALTGIQPWQRALGTHSSHVQHDYRYQEFLEYPGILRQRFPISKEFDALLQALLHPDPLERMPIHDTRAMIEEMPCFLAPSGEHDALEGEAREVAINIGLLPDPYDGMTDTDSVLSDTTTICASSFSCFIPTQAVDRIATSSSATSPTPSATSEDSDSDEGPETPQTLPFTVDEAHIVNTDLDVPNIEKEMARVSLFEDSETPSSDIVEDLGVRGPVAKNREVNEMSIIAPEASTSVIPAR